MTTSKSERRESAPPDEVLSAVANDHRRVILRTLNQADEKAMEMSALVDQISERVRDGEPPGDGHRRRVHIALHHIHLPHLEECGMIVRDTETDRVRNVTGELSEELLTLVKSYEIRE